MLTHAEPNQSRTGAMAEIVVDICVVGAGSGGATVASAAAQLGFEVVLVDAGDRGDLFRIAAKAFIAAGRSAEAQRGGGGFGVTAANPHIDAARLREHIHETVSEMRARAGRVPFDGVRIIRERAAFLDKKRLRAGETNIRAKTFVIAAGTRPLIPDLAGLKSIPFFTTDTIFEKDFKPSHLIILGGGSAGIELAQAHRRLGSEVTVIDNARLLPRYERHLAQIVLDQLLREGIRLREGAKIARIERSSIGVRVEIGRVQGMEVIEGSHLLVATGRLADIETLDLAKARVECDGRGIKVDDDLRTTNKRIYAIGEAAMAPHAARGSSWQASYLVRNLLVGHGTHGSHDALPSVLNSDPEIATIGIGAAEAKKKKLAFDVVTTTLEDTDRGKAERVGDSLIEVVVGKKGRVLGVSMVAPNAAELIVPWILAISEGIPLSHLAGLIMPYPSLGEHMKRLTASYYSSPLFNRREPQSTQVLAGLR